MMTNPTHCPCLSGKTYQDCCEPYHLNNKAAQTAEQLMRSRYSAFVMHQLDYLLATLHSSSHQANERELLQQAIESTNWLGLKIISHQQQQTQAFVEFVAFYQADPVAQLHERSTFIKEEGQWFYVTGEFLPDIKLGRNDPCFCGSGKKLKRCHAI